MNQLNLRQSRKSGRLPALWRKTNLYRINTNFAGSGGEPRRRFFNFWKDMKIPKRKLQMTYVFFDQNVAAKLSQKKNRTFWENIERHLSDKKEKYFSYLTPFSLLEFAGVEKKRIFNIPYKGKKWEEYLFSSYGEFDRDSTIQDIKSHFDKQIPKSFLKRKLENKKPEELSEYGKLFINSYIEDFDNFYDDIKNYWFLDRMAVINTSKCSRQDKDEFIKLWTCLLMEQICSNRSGNFRIVHKLYGELRKKPIRKELKNNTEFMMVQKEVPKLLEKSQLKSHGDLVDCDIIYHAFFGRKNCIAHIYTSDPKNIIENRLKLYCFFIKPLINWVFSDKLYLSYIKGNAESLYQRIQNNKRPKFRCGKVLVVERETGIMTAEIPVAKIYEGKGKDGTIASY